MYRANLRNNKPEVVVTTMTLRTIAGRATRSICGSSGLQSEHNIATISLQHLTYLFQHFCFY
ncbi:hypothetical protein Bca101_048526 [Brassica carinata]